MSKVIFIFIYIVCACLSSAQVNFDEYFTGAALRIDYEHSGNSNSEKIIIKNLLEEGNYPGSKKNLIDSTLFGDYYYVVFDSLSGKKIFSRGNSTLFFEWQTTAEAKLKDKTFSESVRIPFPKNTIKFQLNARDSLNKFYPIFSSYINPENYFIKKERKYQFEKITINLAGKAEECYDLVILPEGYKESEMDEFLTDAERYAGYLFKYQPFTEYKNKINIYAVKAPSIDSGPDIPKENVWKNTLLGTTFYTFDSERYLMTEDYYSVMDLASCADYDNIIILVNTEKYGGGGIYNFYATFAAKNPSGERIFIHELGHSIAGLADEYYESSVSYEEYFSSKAEPWQANITTMVDFDKKWKSDINEGIPVPTPLKSEYKNELGAFEGGGYSATGVFRPTVDSIMKSLSESNFNAPSLKAIKKVLDMHTK